MALRLCGWLTLGLILVAYCHCRDLSEDQMLRLALVLTRHGDRCASSLSFSLSPYLLR